jgi:nitrous oxidase accessory protein
MNRMWGSERTVAVLTILLVLGYATVAVAGPTTDGRVADGDDLAFDQQVPDEYRFDPPTRDGVARVDGERFDTVGAALSAAERGDTVVLAGRFHEHVTVTTPNVTITSAPGQWGVLDGGGEGDVVTVDAPNVTLDRVWVRNNGYDAGTNDAGVWVNGSGARVVDSRVTDVTFGIWVNGVDGVLLRNNTIVGRESVRPLTRRGNGVQLWKTEDTLVAGNRITDVRDGIYYSWAKSVVARNNTMWQLRYGVHYMYSDDCRLVGNTAFDNDAGYALMVSQGLEIVDNVAVNNTGRSGHGILLKSVDRTTVRGNHVVGNDNGLYVYNSLDNRIVDNLVLDNDVGVHLTAGSVREEVHGNTFVANGEPVKAVLGQQVAWNDSSRGNYWAGARVADADGDGVSEVRYRPAGTVERLTQRNPLARTFAASPAFDAIRRAESTVPVVESPGVVDHHPLTDPRHDWRRYYRNGTEAPT